MKTYDIFLDRLPHIDLHGYDRESAKVAVNDFILESSILNHKEVVIIHGIGQGLVKEIVHQTLTMNKLVESYKIASTNIVCTIVTLKDK